MRTLIISCFGRITYIFQNLEIKNLHHQFLLCYNSTKLYQRIQNLLVLVQLLSVNNSFYHSISVNLILNVTLLLTFPLLRMSNYILGYLGHFSTQGQKMKIKTKKIHSEKILIFLHINFFLYFRLWNFLASRLKTFLYVFEKICYIFPKI